jgi:hypothetical protein
MWLRMSQHIFVSEAIVSKRTSDEAFERASERVRVFFFREHLVRESQSLSAAPLSLVSVCVHTFFVRFNKWQIFSHFSLLRFLGNIFHCVSEWVNERPRERERMILMYDCLNYMQKAVHSRLNRLMYYDEVQ